MLFFLKKTTLSILFFFVSFFVLFPSTVSAADSCTASVSPASVQTSTGTSFSFSLTNTGDAPIVYFRIARPSANFTLENRGIDGWKITANSEQADVYNNSIAVGETLNFSYYALSGPNEAGPADWTLSVSSGGDLVPCTGSLSTSITGVTDTTGPVISNVTASNITGSTALITWTTNEPATSEVNYTSDGAEDGTKTAGSLVTSHSVTVDGLSSSQLFYYFVCSKDALNNESCNTEQTFTTSAASSNTSSSTPTPTPTPTVAPSPSPTPPPVDRTPPVVTIRTDFETPFETAPLVEGIVTDNEIVTRIEYSIDGGRNWTVVDDTENINSTRATYEFTPRVVDDGNYDIMVRAFDRRANRGQSKLVTMVIDRLPPRIGGNLISLGLYPLFPDAMGTVIALPGIEQKITLSAVGGPIAIDLYVEDKKIPLDYSPETNLWTGYIKLEEVGEYQLRAEAVDGADNRTERELNILRVVQTGEITDMRGEAIVQGALSVYSRDETTGLWNIWDGQAFGQENPQLVENGDYQLFLPPGTYYLQLESPGFQNLKTQIFRLEESQPITSDFVLEDGRVIDLGFITFPLPPFLQNTKPVNLVLKAETVTGQSSSELIGQLAAPFTLQSQGDQFTLADIRGENSVLSFVSIWSPPSIEQISIINQLGQTDWQKIRMVSTQETASKVQIFNERGNYQAPIWLDPDGEIVDDYRLTTLPTHFVLDRTGTIVDIISGVLSTQELLDLLSQ